VLWKYPLFKHYCVVGISAPANSLFR